MKTFDVLYLFWIQPHNSKGVLHFSCQTTHILGITKLQPPPPTREDNVRSLSPLPRPAGTNLVRQATRPPGWKRAGGLHGFPPSNSLEGTSFLWWLFCQLTQARVQPKRQQTKGRNIFSEANGNCFTQLLFDRFASHEILCIHSVASSYDLALRAVPFLLFSSDI